MVLSVVFFAPPLLLDQQHVSTQDSDYFFQTELAKKTEELGGIHKYDLTPDVTHLVVGDYDTPKYRHVAKERTDIKAMDAGWIDTVGELWMADAEIDFPALEREWQLKPLETCGEMPDPTNPTEGKRGSLLLCMTGFDDRRCMMGHAERTADLTFALQPNTETRLSTESRPTAALTRAT